MKLLQEVIEKELQKKKETQDRLCDHVSTPMGIQKTSPFLASTHQCQFCRGFEHYCHPTVEKSGNAISWVCANTICEVYNPRSYVGVCIPPTKQLRSLEWPSFCVLNMVGDLDRDVKFEDIHEDVGKEKIEYMKKFIHTPTGIILMEGKTGRGKTYCALAMCELFTKKNASCFFRTQEQISHEWLLKRQEEKSLIFKEKLSSVNLLVIDDFGTGEVPPGFMKFFMDVISTRLRWSDRGTVITTNLDKHKMSEVCGEALSDRLSTGMKFLFNGPLKRKQRIL